MRLMRSSRPKKPRKYQSRVRIVLSNELAQGTVVLVVTHDFILSHMPSWAGARETKGQERWVSITRALL
jgi:hypothetical protein